MRARINHKPIRRLAQSVVAVVLLAGVNAAPASASELISVSSDELLIAEPGTRTNLAEVPVDPAQVGQTCRLTVLSQNQASIHNGNDLIVTTGDLETVIPDVEAEANAETDLSTEIVLGTSITVELQMGPDWVSSLGFSLSLDCGAEEPVVVSNEPPTCTDTSDDSEPVVADNPAETPSETPGIVEGSGEETFECEPPVEPEPLPIEIASVPPTIDLPSCPNASDGSLTVDSAECPEPPADDPAPKPVAPAPTPEPEPTPTPDPEPVPATPTPSPDVKSDPVPEVLGVKTERLPQSAPAVAIPKTPNYNG